MKQDTIQDLGLKMLSKRKRSGVFEIVVKVCNVITLFYYASKAWRRKTMFDVNNNLLFTSASSNLRFGATQPNLEVFSTKTLFLFEIKDRQSHLKYQKVVFEGTCTYFFRELLTEYQRLLPVQFFPSISKVV